MNDTVINQPPAPVAEQEKAPAPVAEKPKRIRDIQALSPSGLQLHHFSYNRWDAMVPGDMTAGELESPKFWTHVGGKLGIGDEIRVVGEDYAFVAYLFVTYVQGSAVRVKIINIAELDNVDHINSDDFISDYDVKFRGGMRKWSIVNNKTGEVFKEGIPTQLEAMKELDDYMRALAS